MKREVGDSGTLLVLDPADNPIVNWKEIPLCLSPQISGAMMENIRRVNKAVRQRDLCTFISELCLLTSFFE